MNAKSGPPEILQQDLDADPTVLWRDGRSWHYGRLSAFPQLWPSWWPRHAMPYKHNKHFGYGR